LINFTPINPIKALFWSAVLNGVVAVPLMITIMLMSGNKKVMGRFTLTTRLKIGGWLATAAMTAAAVGLFATW
jgi:Mn2+/Fe2+ NRAMP family transporter